MTDDELQAIEAWASAPENATGFASGLARDLLAEVRRLRGVIKSARGADYGWCVWCHQRGKGGSGDPDKHQPDCPAFTEDGWVR